MARLVRRLPRPHPCRDRHCSCRSRRRHRRSDRV